MSELNAAIRDIPMPARLARRPVSDKGFPVPWFVSMIDGEWDFVNLVPGKIGEAFRKRICFLCGEPLGQFAAFVIGPMCAINRVSAEPPSHRECAEYAVKACPFLARPNARRNEKAALGKPEDVPGVMIEHNPGVTLIWITKSYRPQQGLFHLGEPVAMAWFKEGRNANRAEIDVAIAKGLPLLRKQAQADGGDSTEALEKSIKRAEHLLPP